MNNKTATGITLLAFVTAMTLVLFILTETRRNRLVELCNQDPHNYECELFLAEKSNLYGGRR